MRQIRHFTMPKNLQASLQAKAKKNIKEMQRSTRLSLMLPVKVRGVNIVGKRFSEDATIKDISSRRRISLYEK